MAYSVYSLGKDLIDRDIFNSLKISRSKIILTKNKVKIFLKLTLVSIFFELYNKKYRKGFNRQIIGNEYSSSLLARQQILKRFPALH